MYKIEKYVARNDNELLRWIDPQGNLAERYASSRRQLPDFRQDYHQFMDKLYRELMGHFGPSVVDTSAPNFQYKGEGVPDVGFPFMGTGQFANLIKRGGHPFTLGAKQFYSPTFWIPPGGGRDERGRPGDLGNLNAKMIIEPRFSYNEDRWEPVITQTRAVRGRDLAQPESWKEKEIGPAGQVDDVLTYFDALTRMRETPWKIPKI